MDLELSGKTAIVTGGASHIGRAIALTLAREGANVIIADLDEEQGKKTAATIIEGGSSAICIKTDVTDIASVQQMFGQAVDQYDQIHILVNNVGWDAGQYFLETEPAFWDKVIALNYRHQLNMLRTALPHMVEKGYGRVVNIGSDAGRVGEFREAVYSGCKAGVIALSKAVAREVGRHNITINVVCPGLTTPTTAEEVGVLSGHSGRKPGIDLHQMADRVVKGYALRRLGQAQDIANAVAFFASDAANFVTGQTISVSGGYSMVG